MFTDLSVEDNLRLGGHGLARADLRSRVDETWERFPQLRNRRKEAAGSLSGGQRKLLGVARVLVRRPKLVMMDEPSSGLSPLFVNELVDTLAAVRRDERVTLLLAEQNVRFLRIADRVCVIEGGRSRFTGTVEAFEQTADLQEAFFGLSAEH